MTEDESRLSDRIERMQTRVADAAARSGRSADEITVVAVTKTVDRATVDAAYRLGLRHFGENRVQDAVAKFRTALPSDAVLHMIGRLQSNKTDAAIRLFQIIESVDRPSLVTALEHKAASLEIVVPVLLQVNVAGEEQKAGCHLSDAKNLVGQITSSTHLRLRGLMTIAPLVDDAETVRPVFRALLELRDALGRDLPGSDLQVLSMGMTNDFTVAIEEGATHVRVGRAIFS